MKVVIFGSGSFGTAMATAVARNGHEVVVLSRSEEISVGINEQHRNLKYLTEFDLLPNISSTCDADDALRSCDFIIHSVPVQASMQYLSARRDVIPAHVPIVSTSKGLHSELLLTMNEIIPQALGRDQPCAFLSGPSFAKEIMRDMPTAVVVASSCNEVMLRVQALFKTDRMRVYTCKDVVGVEVGGALKNVFAIACGIAEGCGLGYNSAAALVTRGLSEMRKLALAMGAEEQTLSGLSGVGDLMLTCFGPLSRNRTVGVRLGKGESMNSIMSDRSEVAEVQGIFTTPAAAKWAEKLQLDLPIIQTVAKVILEQITVQEAITLLLSRPIKEED